MTREVIVQGPFAASLPLPAAERLRAAALAAEAAAAPVEGEFALWPDGGHA